jgi:hypothetical protein
MSKTSENVSEIIKDYNLVSFDEKTCILFDICR